MPLKNPNLREVRTTVSIEIYDWIKGMIKEGRYARISDVLREALYDLKHRKETTITSYRE